MKKEPAKKLYKKKILIVAIALIFLWVSWWIIAYLGINQKPDFQEYTPTKFPPGLSLKNGGDFDLLRVSNPAFRQDFGFPSFNKHINIYFNAPNSWITEMAAGPNVGTCYGEPSDAHCQILTTPKGQKYAFTDGNTDFKRGDTDITVSRAMNDKHSREEFIDSFVPTHFKGLVKLVYSYGA